MGGKVAGSVSAKTVCLINNDIASNSSKNKKAKELGIPIVTEETFMTEYLGMSI
jgi:DNA ligase (NAD+)